ncbi:WLM-domain-containing protein [Myriangium duriaei CBS 260.36]|uniref:WLM-domain-containing protein n=1 Tax=Myriangium duriaei CBS 260.36 TaxID=1168546 RepID=A0A9P4MPP7_9PEZI|nr:WLM-domain-containing protein [Myriangium duriaei CBS 260.36]
MTSPSDTLRITLTFHRQPLTLALPSNATISDLSTLIETDFSIPSTQQKLLISPKPGLLRPPFPDPSLPLSALLDRKITLLGSTASAVSDLNTTLATVRARAEARSAALSSGRKVKVNRYVDPRRVDEAKYSFARIEPLSHLPNPDASRAMLERLASDRGIRAAMRTHKFSVGLLTEMDPAAHTTHESRTLGLNRNAGEVIELRLWTDDYRGFRDWKTIRKTLCHELAHNVFGEHDGKFWKLMREIEDEVIKIDDGGRSMGGSFAEEEEEEEHVDGGGWSGGSYVLGGVRSAGGGMSRREILAKAAEERMRKVEKEAKREDDGD